MNNSAPYKLFGVALDASDDPFSLQLKHAAMDAQEQGVEGIVVDPYDALLRDLAAVTGIVPFGKSAIPSWLGAIPKPDDRDLVTGERIRQFVDDGGILKVVRDVNDFVNNHILPARPAMVGIDHAATAGVVAALSERWGPDNLTVLVLDRHFDALPLSVRMAAFAGNGINGPSFGNDVCCCGNFWASLIADGATDPRHLVFVGVADYPASQTDPDWRQFRKSYMAYEEQGCKFFPLQEFTGGYERRLREFLLHAITTPYLYVSLDLDVGAYRAVHAARYMDGPGIGVDALLRVAEIIAQGGRSGSFELVGMDVMEFNMHFLGLETRAGEWDRTLQTAVAFVRTLVDG